MAAAMDFGTEDQANEACQEGKQAVMQYFHYLNAHRNLTFEMFHPTAQLTWNRMFFEGAENIQTLFTFLPAIEYELNIIHALPILDSVNNGMCKVLLETFGMISFANKDPLPFQQSFIATAAEDHWIFCATDFLLLQPQNV